MKFTVKQNELSRALDLCKTTADSKSDNPFSRSVLLTVNKENNTVSFFSTNLIVSAQCELIGSVESEGSCVLDSEKLRAAVRVMPAGMITIQADNKKFSAKISGTGVQRKFGLHGLNPDHFPQIPKLDNPEKAPVYTLTQEQLDTAIKRVRQSSALVGAGRMHLAGVLFEFRETSFLSVALNGITFSRFEQKDDFGSYAGSFFVPAMAFSPIRLISEGDVSFSYTSTDLFIWSKVGRVTCKFPEGTFPDWKEIMRSSASMEDLACEFDVEQLMNIVRGLTSVAKGNLKLSLKGQVLSVALSKTADSQGDDTLPVKAAHDRTFECLMTSEALMAVLEGAEGGIAKLLWDGSDTQPVTVASDDNYIGITMTLARE